MRAGTTARPKAGRALPLLLLYAEEAAADLNGAAGDGAGAAGASGSAVRRRKEECHRLFASR